jgi:hypothetical protein
VLANDAADFFLNGWYDPHESIISYFVVTTTLDCLSEGHFRMEIKDIFGDLPLSVIGAVAALLAGTIPAFLVTRNAKQDPSRDIEQISGAVSASASEARSRALAAIAEKLPAGVTKEELEALTQVIIRTTAGDHRVALVEDLVTSYHQQALSQARAQFWFSVVAATVGFLYILFAAATADAASPTTYIKILPGVVVDAVAALFFRQAEQTRQRATELYDRLRRDQQTVRAEALADTIDDPNIRSAVKAQITLHMVGLTPKEIDLTSFLTTLREAAKIA